MARIPDTKSRMREDAVYAMTIAGMPDVEIAKLIGVKPDSIRRIRMRIQPRLAKARGEFNNASEEAKEKILRALSRSVDTLVYCLDSEKDADKIKAAVSLLDRGGLGPKSSIELSKEDPYANLTPEAAADLLEEKAAQLRRISGVVDKLGKGDDEE